MNVEIPVTRSPWFWLAVFIGATALIIGFLESRFPGTLSNPDNRFSIVHQLGWLALLLSSVIVGWRSRPKTTLRHAAIWFVIIVVLTGVISFKDDFSRIGNQVVGHISPTTGIVGADGSTISFPMAQNGHFMIQAEVNGERVIFLVDTGASDIVLSPRDARRLGYNPDDLDFVHMTMTANGLGRAAPIRLRQLSIGPISMHDLPASVNEADMPESLLGMEFLKRLRSWSVEGSELTLVP